MGSATTRRRTGRQKRVGADAIWRTPAAIQRAQVRIFIDASTQWATDLPRLEGIARSRGASHRPHDTMTYGGTRPRTKPRVDAIADSHRHRLFFVRIGRIDWDQYGPFGLILHSRRCAHAGGCGRPGATMTNPPAAGHPIDQLCATLRERKEERMRAQLTAAK